MRVWNLDDIGRVTAYRLLSGPPTECAGFLGPCIHRSMMYAICQRGVVGMSTRYEMRKSGSTWLVWDKHRECIAPVEGKLAIGLEVDYATDLVNLMNRLEEMFEPPKS